MIKNNQFLREINGYIMHANIGLLMKSYINITTRESFIDLKKEMSYVRSNNLSLKYHKFSP